jgi:hypothetical protein
MHERHLDYDAATSTTETFHFDPYEDRLVVEVTQDIAPILEDNKMFMCDARSDYKGSDTHRVASIPHSMLPALQKQGIMDMGGRILDKVALKRFLNDRDNLWLRTRPGWV